MKKLLFILLACFFSVSLVSLGIAQTPDGITPEDETICDGLEGSAFDLCEAYCEAQDCELQPDDRQSCQSLRKNYAKHTGTEIFPCEVACCICSTGGQSSEGQLCEHTTEDECADRGGLQVGELGEFSCADVSCTAESDEPGCVIGEDSPYYSSVVPPCINGISETCLPFGGPPEPPCPRGPRLCTFLGGTLADESCPGVPLCEE